MEKNLNLKTYLPKFDCIVSPENLTIVEGLQQTMAGITRNYVNEYCFERNKAFFKKVVENLDDKELNLLKSFIEKEQNDRHNNTVL